MKRALVTGTVVALAALAAAPVASARESITPINATYSPQTVGTTSAAQTFTLRVQCQEDVANPGTCQMTTPFSPTFAVTGDFVLVSEDCPATLPGDTFFGTSCQIQVAFSPKTLGDHTGLLETGSAFARASLRGQGSPLPAIPMPGPLPSSDPQPRKCKKKPKKRAGVAAKKCKRKKKR